MVLPSLNPTRRSVGDLHFSNMEAPSDIRDIKEQTKLKDLIAKIVNETADPKESNLKFTGQIVEEIKSGEIKLDLKSPTLETDLRDIINEKLTAKKSLEESQAIAA